MNKHYGARFAIIICWISLVVSTSCTYNYPVSTESSEILSEAGSPSDVQSALAQPAMPSSPEPTIPATTGDGDDMLTHTDSTYGFSIGYPTDFTIRIPIEEELQQFEPQPGYVISFLNPEIAASDIVELELADLEIRIFAAPEGVPLTEWLIEQKILPVDETGLRQAFPAEGINGVEVCSSMPIFPDCYFFTQYDGWIYQLTAATQTGQAMLPNFRFIQ